MVVTNSIGFIVLRRYGDLVGESGLLVSFFLSVLVLGLVEF